MFGISRKIISLFFSVGFVVLVLVYFAYNRLTDGSNGKNSGEFVLVKQVIDGDTFILSTGEKVRLLGIDAPEKYDSKKLDRNAESSGMDRNVIKKLGQLSGEYVKKLVEGKKVRLEKEPDYESKDEYGRLLRYVYLENGECVNAKIIEDGYGQVFESFPVSKTIELKKLQKEAREKKRGLWGEIDGLEQLN